MSDFSIDGKEYKLEDLAPEQQEKAVRLREIVSQKATLRITLNELATLEQAYVNSLRNELQPKEEEKKEEKETGDQNGG